MAALPLSTRISQTSSGGRVFKIIKTSFGNGYEQRRKDGINNNRGSWNIRWDNVSSTDRDTIVADLEATAGVTYVLWQSPDDTSQKKWIVSGYNTQSLSGNIFNVSTDLTEVFEV